jgi:hypothetical protein
MVRNPILKRYLVIGVILLFIGIAVEPNINQNVVKASDNNNLVEITIQVCGINGYGDTTINLTRDQYQNLERYLIDFRDRLNHTTTWNETVTAFNEAIVKLDTYRLLPDGMNVEHAQRLVTEASYHDLGPGLHKNLPYKSQMRNTTNFFCLIAGETTMNTKLFGIMELGSSVLCWFLYTLSYVARQLHDDTVTLNKTISLLNSLRTFSSKINSKRIIGTGILTFGHSHPAQIPPPYRYDPAVGWISTQGLLGKKSWNGSFFGHIFRIMPFDSDSYTFYIGALGFVGIKLYKGNGGYSFIGSAVYVNIADYEE